MARADDDSWDLASSVGVTATMVATARALATAQHDPLVDDPFAAPLVRAVGVDAFVRVLDGETTLDDPAGVGLLIDMIAVRTKFFDDAFTTAAGAGIRQAVILASGLDSRGYRLPWPPNTAVYEIDLSRWQLRSLGAPPGALRVAAAPGSPILAATTDGRIWSYTSGPWRLGPRGYSPAYPGS